MPEFAAVVAPYKENMALSLSEEEGKRVLRTTKETKTLRMVAHEVDTLPCTYAVGRMGQKEGKVVVIEGTGEVCFEALPFFKGRTFMKEKETEEFATAMHPHLSLEFGGTQFLKKHAQFKKLKEITENTTAAASEALSQIQGQTKVELPEPKKVPIVPPHNLDAPDPSAIYEIDSILEIAPESIFVDLPETDTLAFLSTVNLSPLIHQRLSQPPPKATTRQYARALLLMDVLYILLKANNKEKLAHTLTCNQPLQSQMLKGFIAAHMPRALGAKGVLRLEKDFKLAIIARMIVLHLLLSNLTVDFDAIIPLFPNVSICLVKKIMLVLGCSKASTASAGAGNFYHLICFPKP
ncbi:DNA-directed RNA polymerase I subunit RPA49 [Nematocida displodere]|uniref:DNA-directed RNA polymerase I subunit RPA49 n=1 Tax=Nematocida displodere TaxID=1805483 RepID=A0A177EFI0_9MICR|nr:DNA-directed RNA polymerase I subunit RPA49 [Nematocida displodere]